MISCDVKSETCWSEAEIRLRRKTWNMIRIVEDPELAEGRNAQGVPVLSKLPYINRLFKNVGIGRESQSLMLMVTPRIIIQEEEEEKLGIELTQ